MEKTVRTKTLPARINKVRDIIRSADNTIGSVHFTKRGGGERKMAFRLHVTNPSVARAPKSLSTDRNLTKRLKDLKNLQLTVFDVNKVNRDKDGQIIGRGAWRTVPLENVTRICVKGTVYNII